MQISVCNYGLEKLIDWEHFLKKVDSTCQTAVLSNSTLLLLPEYFSLELCSLLSSTTLAEQLDHLQTYLNPFLKLFSQLAQQYKLYIAAGTFPTKYNAQQYYNRCYFFYPNGQYDFQDKCYLTQDEKLSGLFAQGTAIKTFATTLGLIAIQICYDVELPALTQQYMQYPIDLLLVPSCTETTAGLNRVQTCARARAIEQQCYVLQSGLNGSVDYCAFIDANVAQSGVYCPSDIGLANDGILLNSEYSKIGVYTTEIDLNKIHFIRTHGSVSNFTDLQNISSLHLELINAK